MQPITLSVLIPTRNYVCTKLVQALHRQAEELLANRPELLSDYEIIVGDDASSHTDTLVANRQVNVWPHCRCWETPCNQGRAAIRNRLGEMAVMEFLLFIDADAEVNSDDFLLRYVRMARTAPVVCGSLRNVPVLPSPDVSLRFCYESAADRKRTVAKRARSPYHSLSTFNFLIERRLFLNVRFNEQCTRYGYEDTYFCMDLKRRAIPVLHIENRLTHLGLDCNSEFLHKSETALQTLHSLDEEMWQFAAVSRTAMRLEKWHLAGLMRFFHRVFSGMERHNLLSTHPSLLVFNLYKLGYFLALAK